MADKSSNYSHLLRDDFVDEGQVDPNLSQQATQGLSLFSNSLQFNDPSGLFTRSQVQSVQTKALDHIPAPITNLSNKAGFNLYIEHVPTGYKVDFPAFMTSHTDAYTSNWTEQTVFGRMDPIATFESTKRVSSLSFKVVAYGEWQAASNLDKINRLISFLYPTYTERGSSNIGTTVNMGPLVRVKYGNQVVNTQNGKGLLGYITTGITVTPDLEAGVMASSGNSKQNYTGISGQEYLYKAYELNFELTVLHEHSLGFVERNSSRRGNKKIFVFRSNKGTFPYNTGRFNRLPGVKSSVAKPRTATLVEDIDEEGLPSVEDREGRLKLAEKVFEQGIPAGMENEILPLLRSGDSLVDQGDADENEEYSGDFAYDPEDDL